MRLGAKLLEIRLGGCPQGRGAYVDGRGKFGHDEGKRNCSTICRKTGWLLDRLTRRGALTEADVDAAMREVRPRAARGRRLARRREKFYRKVREQGDRRTVVKSVTPGQMVVKIVHDELIATLGSDGQSIDLNAVPPVAIMMVGLQGSGKTTTTAKLARA